MGGREFGSRSSGHRQQGGRDQGNREHGTSWEKSADWYDLIIGERGSELYQAVVIPGALKLLAPKRGERVLDLGCGQGVFSRALAQAGCQVTGVDAAPTLIQKARTYPVKPPVRYLARDAAQIEDLGEFDAASAILCVQNMEHLDVVSAAAAKVLKPGGRMLWVVNHPAFRIPRQSSWGNDEATKIQYRRTDAYSSTLSIPIIMHPGRADSESTKLSPALALVLDCCSRALKSGIHIRKANPAPVPALRIVRGRSFRCFWHCCGRSDKQLNKGTDAACALQ